MYYDWDSFSLLTEKKVHSVWLKLFLLLTQTEIASALVNPIFTADRNENRFSLTDTRFDYWRKQKFLLSN